MYHFYYMGGSLGLNVLMLLLIVWTLCWKCYSSWLAAKNGDKTWFVALVILNTLGILDMIYVFGIKKKKWSDLDHAARRFFSSRKK